MEQLIVQEVMKRAQAGEANDKCDVLLLDFGVKW